MPDEDITFTDLIRGDVTFPAGSVPTSSIVRANGGPLYTLVNPVDDAAMGITHVMRGEDLLSSTPRQIALYRALVAIGAADARPGLRAHAARPRRGQQEAVQARPAVQPVPAPRPRLHPRGHDQLPGRCWAGRIADDRDLFTPDELVAAFDIARRQPNPARWDQKKAEAINAEHIRLLAPEDFTARLVPYLQRDGVLPTQPPRRPRAACRRRRAGADADQRALGGHADGGSVLPGRRRTAGGR